MRVLAFGGGTDSTGILCQWAESGLVIVEPIDLSLFPQSQSNGLSTHPSTPV